MSRFPKEFKYAPTHEWAIKDHDDDNVAIVGVTDFAQNHMGEIVYVELPEVGLRVAAGDEVCVLESVKTASDVYSPLSGKIVAVNEDLEDAPGMVNTDPYQDGWLFKIELKDQVEFDELLEAEDYKDSLIEDAD